MKKIKFLLEMENQIKVNTLESLRENFSITKVIEYILNGQMEKWLIDRNYIEEANKIKKLDIKDKGLGDKICNIFKVSISNEQKEVEKTIRLNNKKKKLQEYTSEVIYFDNIDKIVFSQRELDYLITTNINEIYLCGDEFKVSDKCENIIYIGVNEPKIITENLDEDKAQEKNIKFKNVNIAHMKCIDENNEVGISKYINTSLVNYRLNQKQLETAEQMYDVIKNNMKQISTNKYVNDLVKIVKNEKIYLSGKKYIDMLN